MSPLEFTQKNMQKVIITPENFERLNRALGWQARFELLDEIKVAIYAELLERYPLTVDRGYGREEFEPYRARTVGDMVMVSDDPGCEVVYRAASDMWIEKGLKSPEDDWGTCPALMAENSWSKYDQELIEVTCTPFGISRLDQLWRIGEGGEWLWKAWLKNIRDALMAHPNFVNPLEMMSGKELWHWLEV